MAYVHESKAKHMHIAHTHITNSQKGRFQVRFSRCYYCCWFSFDSSQDAECSFQILSIGCSVAFSYIAECLLHFLLFNCSITQFFLKFPNNMRPNINKSKSIGRLRIIRAILFKAYACNREF